MHLKVRKKPPFLTTCIQTVEDDRIWTTTSVPRRPRSSQKRQGIPFSRQRKNTLYHRGVAREERGAGAIARIMREGAKTKKETDGWGQSLRMSQGRSFLFFLGRTGSPSDKSCRRPISFIPFRTSSPIRIMSRRAWFASARKAWSSAGRRGPRSGVGAGVCVGVGRRRKEKDLMVGQVDFCVFCCCGGRTIELVRRQLYLTASLL